MLQAVVGVLPKTPSAKAKAELLGAIGDLDLDLADCDERLEILQKERVRDSFEGIRFTLKFFSEYKLETDQDPAAAVEEVGEKLDEYVPTVDEHFSKTEGVVLPHEGFAVRLEEQSGPGGRRRDRTVRRSGAGADLDHARVANFKSWL